ARPPRPAGAPDRARSGRPEARSVSAAGLARPDRDQALAEGDRAARAVPAPAGRGDQPVRAPRPLLGHELRQPLQRRHRPHPPPAREDRPPLRPQRDRDRPRRRLPASARWPVSRLPIRVRLTLAFAAAMAALLAALAFLLLHHLAGSLDATLDQGLRARADDVTALVRQSDTGLRDAPSSPAAVKSFAQILDRHGRIVDETRGLGARPLLDSRQLARARAAPLLVGRARRLGVDVRLLAVAVSAQDQPLVVVVGAPLSARDAAIANLRSELLFGGPAALLATALIAYLLASAPLRPVERMGVGARTSSAPRSRSCAPRSSSPSSSLAPSPSCGRRCARSARRPTVSASSRKTCSCSRGSTKDDSRCTTSRSRYARCSTRSRRGSNVASS